jgi:hypothetical protein
MAFYQPAKITPVRTPAGAYYAARGGAIGRSSLRNVPAPLKEFDYKRAYVDLTKAESDAVNELKVRIGPEKFIPIDQQVQQDIAQNQAIFNSLNPQQQDAFVKHLTQLKTNRAQMAYAQLDEGTKKINQMRQQEEKILELNAKRGEQDLSAEQKFMDKTAQFAKEARQEAAQDYKDYKDEFLVANPNKTPLSRRDYINQNYQKYEDDIYAAHGMEERSPRYVSPEVQQPMKDSADLRRMLTDNVKMRGTNVSVGEVIKGLRDHYTAIGRNPDEANATIAATYPEMWKSIQSFGLNGGNSKLLDTPVAVLEPSLKGWLPDSEISKNTGRTIQSPSLTKGYQDYTVQLNAERATPAQTEQRTISNRAGLGVPSEPQLSTEGWQTPQSLRDIASIPGKVWDSVSSIPSAMGRSIDENAARGIYGPTANQQDYEASQNFVPNLLEGIRGLGSRLWSGLNIYDEQGA